MTLTNQEISTLASHFIAGHGDRATEKALTQVVEAVNRGDEQAAVTWRAVVEHIDGLSASKDASDIR